MPIRVLIAEDQRLLRQCFQEVLELDGQNTQAKLELGKYHLEAGRSNPENFLRARDLVRDHREVREELPPGGMTA